jgi:proton-dependent oligopeptide transporter, POT family
MQHPKGLSYLFFTEMWERFGYYLMIGIFVLYLTDTQTGGLGFSRAEAADIYGTFIALVYITPFIGGFLADRYLGYRLSIIIGGILMGLGYSTLYFPQMPAFYGGLLLIILGNGFFKPNISTLLGNLYNSDEKKPLKDSGYNIFYLGINIGAFVCNFVAAYLRQSYGWGYAFLAAGIGMFIGVLVFMLGTKHVAEGDIRKESNPGDPGMKEIFGYVMFPGFAAGILGWMIPGNIFGSDSTDAFLCGAIPILVFYYNLFRKSDPEDKKSIGALLSIYIVVILFWAVFKQNGTALTTWADYYTNREVSTSMAPVASGLGMIQNLEVKKDSFPAMDAQFRTSKENGKVVKTYGVDPYLKNIESVPAEGTKMKLISTEIFQSINPLFIILFTPLVVSFFGFLRRKKIEPTTPTKIFYGLIVSALSCLVMVAAAYYCGNGEQKSSAWWLISTYGVVTIGELFLSPMGLSLVSKLSPPRITALMMGGWQLATSLGNKLSGVLATLWDGYEHKANFFWVNFFLLILAALALLSMLKRLNTIFREKKLI